jgi:hypothetical protein
MNCSGYNKNYGYPGVKGAKTPKECPISFHEGVCSIQKPALIERMTPPRDYYEYGMPGAEIGPGGPVPFLPNPIN